jgi:hypothetical protein
MYVNTYAIQIMANGFNKGVLMTVLLKNNIQSIPRSSDAHIISMYTSF